MTAFWLELKSTFRSFIFLALILVLIAFQAVQFVQLRKAGLFTESQVSQENLAYLRKSESWLRYWQKQETNFNELGGTGSRYSLETIEFHLDWYEYEEKLARGIVRSFAEKDWPQYNRLRAEKGLLDWGILAAFVDWTNIYNTFVTPQQYFGEKWAEYESLVNSREVRRLPESVLQGRGLSSAEHTALTTSYYLQLLEKGTPPGGPLCLTPWAFLFIFLRESLPSVLAIFVLLVTVNLLSREKKFGAIKTNLQRPKSRARFLARKISLGFVSSFFLVSVPQFLFFLLLGITQGFAGANQPTLLNRDILTWSTSSDYAYLLRWSRSSTVGLSQYVRSVWGNGALERLDFIPLWQSLCLTLAVLALFLLFCSVLGTLISLLIGNETAAQVVAAGIFALGSTFGRLWPKEAGSAWDLFAKARVVTLLEGNQAATFLKSVVFLGAAVFFLFGLSLLTFRKQDVISN